MSPAEQERLEKKREYHRRWYAANRESILASNRARYRGIHGEPKKRGRPKLKETQAQKRLREKKLANKAIVRDMPEAPLYKKLDSEKHGAKVSAKEDQARRNAEYFASIGE